MPTPGRALTTLVLAGVAAALAGCDNTAFTVAGGTSGRDAARDDGSSDVAQRDGGASDARSKDARARDGAPADARPQDALAPDSRALDGASADAGTECTLTSAADTVYVSAPDGGAPHNAIAQGITTASALKATTAYVCVGPGRYTETDLVVPPRVVVVGMKGPTATSITGNSTLPCPENSVCAVQVHRGAGLRGFTILAPAGPDASTVPEDGVVALAPVDGVERLLAAATVRDVVVTGFATNGVQGSGSAGGAAIVALSDIDLGPGVTANNNFMGLLSSSPVPASVHIHGTTNSFDSNGWHGIELTGAASLLFEGGSTSSNGNCGIRLGGAAAPLPDGGAPDGGAPLSHTIEGLTATGNGVHGVAVYTAVQILKLRTSTVLATPPSTPDAGGNSGLYYNYGAASGRNPSPLDIGTSGDPGGNTFGIESGYAGAVTKGAGIFLCESAAGAQPAAGDMFSQCSPVLQTQVGSCGELPSAYADVAYAPMSNTGAPVVASGCSTGK
jgi:hypothetical protein